MTLAAPFPWFGGKRRVAPVVWRAFGNVPNYVEPFAGSLAVLLGRPTEPKLETVNDLDCVAPETRLLRADMSWAPAGDICVGDRLLAFDEENGPPTGLRAPSRYRRFARATVTGVRRLMKPCYRLTFDDGTTVVSSADHLWLGGSHKSGGKGGGRGWRWLTTSSLVCNRATQRSWVLKVCGVVEREESFDAGWLSGLYDGEGSVNVGPGLRITVSQNQGPVLDRARDLLTARGIAVAHSKAARRCKQLTATGGKHEQLAILMRLRPMRLIRNFMEQCHEVSLYGRDHRAVGLVSKEFLGEREVVAVETDTRTYIAEGLASHNCYLANFWRAVQHDAEQVAAFADGPVNEADLHARHAWLVAQAEFRERMHSDPDHYDAKVAGWWVWGICQWIGHGWCAPSRARSRQLPLLSAVHTGGGSGVHAARMPALGTSGRGAHSLEASPLVTWFGDLAGRLRRVRVACGDWTRVLSGSITGVSNTRENMGMSPCGVFLDPPYASEGDVYVEGNEVSREVREWALANGDNPKLRIALCGYEGEHTMPSSWHVHAWKAPGGYGNRNGAERNENATRERIWFSPHCLPLEEIQPSLFGNVGK